ncbi:MAG: hypothetical protein DRP71_00750 [Verrucomicrobia bacterium]|nr:MAG: hypothetical protein DRP71_00750 [Verrucomicrobiota bacterium]
MVALTTTLVSSAAAQATATVIAVKDRTLTLAMARELLTIKEGDNSAAMARMRDPFEVMLADVAVVAETSVEVVPAPARYNDRQVLEAIAPGVNPTGTARVGTTDYLLFGQKRLKQGEKLTITYEGSAYLIEITSIQRNNFRIRLNSEELVRPIK